MPKPRRFVIRQLAATYEGSRIAAGEFDTHVQIWDLQSAKQVSAFETGLDFGGLRLAISPDGKTCVAGAYDEGGIGGYDAETGREIWRRTDLQKVQKIRISKDGAQVHCGFDESPMVALNIASGKTQREIAGVKDVWESVYAPMVVHDHPKQAFELLDEQEKVIAKIARKTFAALAFTFSKDRLCISESGGPVTCYDTAGGKELWSYEPGDGVHALKLGYNEPAGTFLAITWPFQRGGERKLLRLDPASGRAEEVTILGNAGEQRLCLRGTVLVSSAGELRNSATGEVTGSLTFFPGNEDPE